MQEQEIKRKKELVEAEMEANRAAVSFEIYQQAEEDSRSKGDDLDECLLPSLLREVNEPIGSYGIYGEHRNGVIKTDQDRKVFSISEHKPKTSHEEFAAGLKGRVACLMITLCRSVFYHAIQSS